MCSAEAIRKAKRLARVAERFSNEWAASDEPWAPANFRLWQKRMCAYESERMRGLAEYLQQRKARAAA